VTSLSEIKAKAQQFAANVGEAAARYAETDQALGSRLNQQQFDRTSSQGQPGSAGGAAGTGSSAGNPMGQMGQMGEMLSIPMEMASQAVQMPMQIAGKLGSLPQGLMQGMQSVQGIAGQFGRTGQLDEAGANVNEPLADQPQQDKAAENQGTPEEQRSEAAEHRQTSGPQRERLEPIPDSVANGAAGGHPANPMTPPITPAPIRPVRPPTEVDL
jgi:hypothetical protein